MKRILLSTAITGLAFLPTLAMAQAENTEQGEGSSAAEQMETGTQAQSGSEPLATDAGDASATNSDAAGSEGVGDGENAAQASDSGGAGSMTGTDAAQGDAAGRATGPDSTGSGSASVQEGHSQTTLHTIAADRIKGAPVHDREGGNVASVSEVLLTGDGSVEALTVDVGGVLGIGAKPVEIPFDRVTLQTNNDTGELSVVIPMSREELENMPSEQG